MPYRKTKFVEDKLKDTRGCIVSAACELVETGGWRNCILTHVAKEASVASGSIYTHFGKITDLYIEVFLSIADEELAVITEIARSNRAPLDRLEEAINVFSSRAMRGRTKAYAVIAEPVAPEVDAVRQDFRKRFVDEYEHIIAQGVRDGDFCAQDPRIAATCVVGAISETLVRPLSDQTEIHPKAASQIQGEILAFCLRAIGLDQAPHKKP